ncbi:hypothetical protein R1sor_005000 [Riccia sorocarpa]|uniref:Uncharacterized protein n=1 Tax=Riccia sorocarpa TaxID=122646 RepID=A0ABD3HLT4_9MARC
MAANTGKEHNLAIQMMQKVIELLDVDSLTKAKKMEMKASLAQAITVIKSENSIISTFQSHLNVTSDLAKMRGHIAKDCPAFKEDEPQQTSPARTPSKEGLEETSKKGSGNSTANQGNQNQAGDGFILVKRRRILKAKDSEHVRLMPGSTAGESDGNTPKLDDIDMEGDITTTEEEQLGNTSYPSRSPNTDSEEERPAGEEMTKTAGQHVEKETASISYPSVFVEAFLKAKSKQEDVSKKNKMPEVTVCGRVQRCKGASCK